MRLQIEGRLRPYMDAVRNVRIRWCGRQGRPKARADCAIAQGPKIEGSPKYKVYLMYNNIGGFNFVNFQLNP